MDCICGVCCVFNQPNSYDIMDRQIRRLDIGLKKFKADLEKKQPGLTAQLLERTLRLC